MVFAFVLDQVGETREVWPTFHKSIFIIFWDIIKFQIW